MKYLICFFIFCTHSLQAGWLERKAEGWAWYEEKESTKKQEENEPLTLTAIEQSARIRKNLEEKLATAVLDPTKENVKSYIEEQKKWIDQSANFSKVWAKVLLEDPSLDEILASRPVTQYGIQVKNQIDLDERTSLIRRLAFEYGLFFFYEGRNKISQAFSLVVKEFAAKYSWEVLAIAVDHHLLEGFKSNQMDNGIAEKWNIQTYPALFAVNPRSGKIIPLAFGLQSLDQIEINVGLQFSGEEHND